MAHTAPLYTALTSPPLSCPLVATEDSPELGIGTKAEEGASWGAPGVRTHSPHTLATFAGVGERTLRSLTNGSTTPGDAGRSAATAGEMESATQLGNTTVTGDARPVSGSSAATRTFGGRGGDGQGLSACFLSVSVSLLCGARLVLASLVAQMVKNLPAVQETWVGKIPGRRKWQPTPVFLPGEFHGQRSPVGCSLWGHKVSDMTE